MFPRHLSTTGVVCPPGVSAHRTSPPPDPPPPGPPPPGPPPPGPPPDPPPPPQPLPMLRQRLARLVFQRRPTSRHLTPTTVFRLPDLHPRPPPPLRQPPHSPSLHHP